ncbi:MAG: hypothetical protein E6R13_00285 [Spirochaetes bacterium]|nr:MAG: hypothetical protein E6R13_00285 [Spirochaetota bacterium]
MSTRRLNKKGLRQQGGEEATPEKAVLQITQQVSELLDGGADPKAVIAQLSESGLDPEQIREILEGVGLASSDIDILFSEEEPQEQVQAEEVSDEEPVEQQDELDDSDIESSFFSGMSLPEEQFGGNIAFPSTINQYFAAMEDGYSSDPAANYLPMNLGMKGTPLGALALAVEAGTDLFGGKKDPSTGYMQGFFRDTKAKKAIREEAKPYYYNYKITKDPNDKNKYVNDPSDLYAASKGEGSLRTEDQYKKDLQKYSKVDFDTESGKYKGIRSAKEFNPDLISKLDQEDFNKFWSKAVGVQELGNRFDKGTADLIVGNKAADVPKGTTIGISPTGQASSYKDAKSNPFYYETMMGINTLQSKQPVAPGADNKPKTYPWMSMIPEATENTSSPNFKDWYMMDPVRRSSGDAFNQYQEEMGNIVPFFDEGGEYELPKAQFGPPDWLSSFISTPEQLQDPMAANAYFKNMGRTNYAEDMQAVADARLQQRQPGLGITPAQEKAQNTFATQEGIPTFTTPQVTPAQPKVEITNKLQGDFNRFMDSRFMEGYGKLSDFAVKGANFVNEVFKEKKRAEAEDELYRMTMADKAYGYYENPVNKRGTWDVNTGLAEQNNRVVYMEDGGELELDLDTDTIAELIAAGADIEII